MLQRTGAGFPPKPADHLATIGVKYAADDALDGIRTAGLVTCVLFNVALRDGVQQTHAGQMGRNAWADRGLHIQGAVGKLRETIVRLTQAVGGAVVKAPRLLGVPDMDRAFRPHTRHGRV